MKPFFLAGRWQKSSHSAAVHNPYTGEHIADVCLADADQVEDAVAAACAAFSESRRSTADARATVLENIARLIGERRDEFAAIICKEAGKPLSLAAAETDRARLTFRFGAALALGDDGHGIAVDASKPGAGHLGLVRRFPIGVILGITPFNFPLNLVAHKIAPCLATGNAMIIKPALKTPLTALLLAEVLEAAGVPAGQIQIVPFDHEHIDALLHDSRVAMISFTGSDTVGWKIKATAAKKKVALELGGNAAVIVEPDCDWSAAIPKIAAGAFAYAGQSCISVQRIFVHSSIYESFRVELVRHTVENLVPGDPASASTLIGPMIQPAARDKVVRWVEEAISAGAKLLTPLRVEGASVLHPVLLENVAKGSPVICQEAFAPLAVLHPYDTLQEALDLVNDSSFGLQAGVFTNDLQKTLLAFETLEVGGVLINQVPTFRVENMPYGGIKDSGFGREGLRYAMEEMTELRSLIIARTE